MPFRAFAHLYTRAFPAAVPCNRSNLNRAPILRSTLLKPCTLHPQALAPSPAQMAARAGVVAALNDALAPLPGFRGFGVEPYGSYVSGFCLPSSDLDMALVGYYSTEALPAGTVAALAAALGPDKARGGSIAALVMRRSTRYVILHSTALPRLVRAGVERHWIACRRRPVALMRI